MYQTVNIPIQAIQYARQRKQFSEARVFIAMKFIGSGQIKRNSLPIDELCKLSGFSDPRTVEKHIQTLLRMNWLGTDGTWLFIRGWNRIQEFTGATSRTTVEISREQLNDLDDILLGSVLATAERRKRNARKKAGAKPTPLQPFSGDTLTDPEEYQTGAFSCSYIGELFNVSPSTACRMKQRAKQKGYFTYQHNTKDTGVYRANIAEIENSFSIDRTRLFIRNGTVHIRLTDTFSFGRNGYHKYHFKTRRQ